MCDILIFYVPNLFEQIKSVSGFSYQIVLETKTKMVTWIKILVLHDYIIDTQHIPSFGQIVRIYGIFIVKNCKDFMFRLTAGIPHGIQSCDSYVIHLLLEGEPIGRARSITAVFNYQ